MRHILAATVLTVGMVAAFAPTVRAQSPSTADPLYQSKGDQKRAYKFPPTGEMLPYRTYVPTNWKPGMKLPLVVVLHGGGLTQDAPFDRSPWPMNNVLQNLAEQFGYIIVSPSGFSQNGAFGSTIGGPPAGPPLPGARPRPPLIGNDANPKSHEYSEEDTMDVIGIVEREYGVDTTKEFITGNSMGGIGTMYLAAKYPGRWLAIAPSEAGYIPALYGKSTYAVKGALLIHKTNAKAPEVETQSAAMVTLLQGQGVDAATISVPNTEHENVWFLSLPVTFHFFDKFVNPDRYVVRPPPAPR